MKNYAEIEAKLKGLEESEGVNSLWDTLDWNEEKAKEFGAKKIESVGGEGEGDHAHIVLFFEEANVYVKKDGHYSSYNGTEWEYTNFYQVTPKEKTITVYE